MIDAVLSNVYEIKRRIMKPNETLISVKFASFLSVNLNARNHFKIESEDSPMRMGLINLNLNIPENVLRDSGTNRMVSRYTLSESWRRLK